MKTMMTKTFAASLFTLTTASSAFAATWDIDATHTAAQFAVKHMLVSTVRGEFQNITGTVDIDDADLSKSKIDVSIDASTVNTRVAKRDEHLKSADFFDVAKFPKLTFRSTKIEKNAKGDITATGDLTIHGVTKSVTLAVTSLTAPVKNPWGQLVRGVSATGKINRKDFGMGWNKAIETGGFVVGDEIDLQIDAELNPAKPAAKS